MAQVGRTVVRERRACAIQDFARGSVARASGDNTLKKYTKTKKAKQYTEKQGARARKGPHRKMYPIVQIPVGLEHAAGRGSRQVGAKLPEAKPLYWPFTSPPEIAVLGCTHPLHEKRMAMDGKLEGEHSLKPERGERKRPTNNECATAK